MTVLWGKFRAQILLITVSLLLLLSHVVQMLFNEIVLKV